MKPSSRTLVTHEHAPGGQNPVSENFLLLFLLSIGLIGFCFCFLQRKTPPSAPELIPQEQKASKYQSLPTDHLRAAVFDESVKGSPEIR